MVLARSRLTHSAGHCSDVLRQHNSERLRWHHDERLRLSTALSAIANRSRLESFFGKRGDWLWDTIEKGLGTYLYEFSGDVMRTDSRLYGIRTKEYPITTGLCTNIRRKSVEEQRMRVGMRGDRGAPTGPT